MKKSLVSILLANVLFFSNIGLTTFAVEQNTDLAEEAAAEEEAESESEEATEEAPTELQYDEDFEPSYVKISGFTELPEYIIDQKVKVGGSLSDIEFPDTLEIEVVPDKGRDERIRQSLAQERELNRLDREREKAEEEAAKETSEEADGEKPKLDKNKKNIHRLERYEDKLS